MDKIYLALTCIFFSVQFIFSKMYQKNSNGSINASLWMTIFYATASLILFGSQIGFTPDIPTTSIIYATIYTFAGILTTLSSILGMKLGKISTISTFMLLGGMVLPFFYGIIFLKESITTFKIIAIIIMIVALIPSLINNDKTKNKENNKKNHLLYNLVLISVFIGNGAISIITNAAKNIVENPSTFPEKDYMFVVATTQIIIAVIVALIIAIKNTVNKKESFSKTLFTGIGKTYSLTAIIIAAFFAAVYGIFNALGNLYSLKCVALEMDASIQFPVISGSVIVLTAFIGWGLFKEKPQVKDWIAITLSVVGVILFNI